MGKHSSFTKNYKKKPLLFFKEMKIFYVMNCQLHIIDDEWIRRAEKEVKEDREKIESKLEEFRTLIRGEKNLYSQMDDSFLLAFLRTKKYNIDEAFSVLKNYYKLRKNYPVHFEDCLPSEKPHVYDVQGMTVLEERDQNQRIVALLRVEHVDLQKVKQENFFQQLSTIISYYQQFAQVQIAGVTIIMDLKGFSYHHFRIITPTFAIILIKFFQDSFPLRIKGVHVVNQPIYFSAIFALFKPFLKEKLRKRIFMHGKNYCSLHEHIPHFILPRELGGPKEYNFSDFKNKFMAVEDEIREWRKYGYDREPEGG